MHHGPRDCRARHANNVQAHVTFKNTPQKTQMHALKIPHTKMQHMRLQSLVDKTVHRRRQCRRRRRHRRHNQSNLFHSLSAPKHIHTHVQTHTPHETNNTPGAGSAVQLTTAVRAMHNSCCCIRKRLPPVAAAAVCCWPTARSVGRVRACVHGN